MKLPTSFGLFSRSQALAFRLPWLALGGLAGFLVMVGCFILTHQMQSAVGQAISSKTISLAQVEQQAASIMALATAGGFTCLALALAGAFVEVLTQRKLLASYRNYLSSFDFSALERFARGLETDNATRSLAVQELSRRQPGWSYR